ncbi:MAG: DJ-1/PfpI family protein [Kofleriaceae bacterium]
MRMLVLLAILVSVPATAHAGAKVRNVAIVLYEGTEILDFAGPAEVLSSASNFAGAGAGAHAMNVYTVARTTTPITAQGFIKITPQYSIDNAPKPDFVVIPGGGSDALSSDPTMMKWLITVTAASEVTLTVCTGAFPLAKAGAFDGLEITTFFGAIEELRRIAPKARVSNGRRFIDNGRYVTTAGVSAGIDGALHVVARMYGRRVADQTARYMEYHWSPESYLAKDYVYWNPSTDDRGRAMQAAALALDEKRLPEAIAVYRKLAATDKDGTTWTALGNTLAQSKDYAGAVEAYKHVPATSPVYAKALYNAGCAYALAGNKAAALTYVQKSFAAGMKREYARVDPDLESIRDAIAKLP